MQQLERAVEIPLGLRDVGLCRQHVRLAFPEARPPVARQAFLGESPAARQVSSKLDGRIRETVKKDRCAQLVAESAVDRQRLLPVLFGELRAPEQGLLSSLHPQTARDEVVGHGRISVEQGRRPVRALLRAVRRPVALERDYEFEPELALTRTRAPR